MTSWGRLGAALFLTSRVWPPREFAARPGTGQNPAGRIAHVLTGRPAVLAPRALPGSSTAGPARPEAGPRCPGSQAVNPQGPNGYPAMALRQATAPCSPY